jgi:lysophospholipase L1-like esterase
MRILIYGDSNSWGYLDDGSGQRFGGRWPQQMAGQLGAEIIEECLPGRVTHGADPVEGPQFDGTAPFLAILMSHQPLDHVIIMLGTNDMKARFDRSAEDISAGVMQLVDIVGASRAGHGGWGAAAAPPVTVICPPMLGKRAADESWERHQEWRGGVEKSQKLPGILGRACSARGLDFVDANGFARSSAVDPIHWQADTHRNFGEAMGAHMDAFVKTLTQMAGQEPASGQDRARRTGAQS